MGGRHLPQRERGEDREAQHDAQHHQRERAPLRSGGQARAPPEEEERRERTRDERPAQAHEPRIEVQRGEARGSRRRREADDPDETPGEPAPDVRGFARAPASRSGGRGGVGAHGRRLVSGGLAACREDRPRRHERVPASACLVLVCAPMPRRTDMKKIMIVGSGPIVIGQACEFDYSGVQACKALQEEGFEVVLLNSNPATIMTDPVFADRTYIEPITPEFAEQILAREKPDALLPTLGGQTALNLAVALARNGALQRHGVQLIGASLEAIEKAEDRQLFKQAMDRIGVEMPKSGYATGYEEARVIADEIGFPIIIRPSFTMGGEGGGVAYNREEFEELARRALQLSPTHTILVEESIIGWKEYELEVMRDRNDNVVIICSIENLDPMGVHTGDSITVAPIQTLTDKEYQRLRDASVRIIREIGVETGGSNIQFGVHPRTGRQVVIVMNPRVSRSSALASKATGFPIAKIAAKLAVGYTLDEIKNDITRETPASFEPTIDYVVTKIPRFAFEKFKGADDTLTTAMKSVGEVMAIGRTFQESFQKAVRGLEIDKAGLESPLGKRWGEAFAPADLDRIRDEMRVPRARRIFWVGEALRAGLTVEEVHAITFIDPWFLRALDGIVREERSLGEGLPRSAAEWRRVKGMGFSDRRLADLTGGSERDVREARWKAGVHPVFKRVDTCAAEFEAYTPYLYSTYEEEDEAAPTQRRKVMILGGGPNRIGQGMEVDYDDDDLKSYLAENAPASSPEQAIRPVLIDRFLRDAAEVDVDVVSDGVDVVVGGIMEHIEEAGIHSGDSACALPPYSLSPALVEEIERQSIALARELEVKGLMNVQFAIQGGDVYVLEVNPRASRTVPFVGKATGVPLAKVAALAMVGKTLREQGLRERPQPLHVSVKEAVFPFARFRGVDTMLGPEMRSTGEVMGIAADFYSAFWKAQAAAGNTLPRDGRKLRAFISVKDADKAGAAQVCERLLALGFELLATRGTAEHLAARGLAATRVLKVQEGRPSVVDRIKDGDVHLVFNTTAGKREIADSYSIRRETLMKGVPYFTTLTGARAAVGAIEAARAGRPEACSLQEYHRL